MGKRLGHMIREFREKQGRTIEEAARGLLSAAELSRVENGTKEIEYLIMEALFETYGKSLDKLDIAYFIIEKKKAAPQPWQAIAQRFCSIRNCCKQ